MATRTEATIEDLYRVPDKGKAELVNGQLLLMQPTGALPGVAAQVVWDVDLLAEDVVQKYTYDRPDVSTRFRRGALADAEPALPGWTMPVDDLFGNYG